jgi:hypothetical protein
MINIIKNQMLGYVVFILLDSCFGNPNYKFMINTKEIG